ncbi:hypothetical protein GH891_33590, partial [Bacillus thuringiensis]|nr:hypothetical protein [Bacillus thuringiensis]
MIIIIRGQRFAMKRNIRSKKSKVPSVEQMSQYECGICCLNMILKYYNYEIKLSELRPYFEESRNGTTLLKIK